MANTNRGNYTSNNLSKKAGNDGSSDPNIFLVVLHFLIVSLSFRFVEVGNSVQNVDSAFDAEEGMRGGGGVYNVVKHGTLLIASVCLR